MSFTVTKNENYNLVKLAKDSLSAGNTESLKTACTKMLKESPFIIFNCRNIEEIDSVQKNLFGAIEALAKRASGSIILSELPENLIDKMEKAGINCVPTDDEAVDFIFMEQIENEFMDEEEDEEEDF